MKDEVGGVRLGEDFHHFGSFDVAAFDVAHVVVGPLVEQQAGFLGSVAAFPLQLCVAAADAGGDREPAVGFDDFVDPLVGKGFRRQIDSLAHGYGAHLGNVRGGRPFLAEFPVGIQSFEQFLVQSADLKFIDADDERSGLVEGGAFSRLH